MSQHVYSEINLHLIWRTKAGMPALVDAVEDRCHRYLTHRAIETQGVVLHAIDGMPDHVHLAVTIPPTLTISEWIGRLKGASSHYINQEICNRKALEWQTGYGVVSFGTKDLPWVVEYIRMQKEHHRLGTAIKRLERVECEPEPQDQSEPRKPAEAG